MAMGGVSLQDEVIGLILYQIDFICFYLIVCHFPADCVIFIAMYICSCSKQS